MINGPWVIAKEDQMLDYSESTTEETDESSKVSSDSNSISDEKEPD